MPLVRALCLLVLLFAASRAGLAEFSFVQVTDTHVQGIPSAAAHDKRVSDMFTEIATLSPRPDFIVHTGDITESGSPAEFSAFNRIQRDTISKIPLYAVPGNHDIRWNPLGKAAFEHDAGQPAYRSFDHDHVHFILLDSTVALEHWGHFDQSELDWLKLDLAKISPGQPIIVGFHHWIGRAPTMVDNEDTLLKLLEPYNVRLFLIGHGHSDILWNINGAPAIMAKGLYQGSYNIVRITADRLQVQRRSDADPKPTKLLVDVPLRREAIPMRSASMNTGPGGLLAAFGRSDLPPGTTVTCRLDDGKPITLDADANRWSGIFPLDNLAPGAHRALFTTSLPDGRAYQTPLQITLTGENHVAPVWQVNVGAAVQSALTGDEASVYVPTTGGDLVAIDSSTGKIRWRFTSHGALYSPPAMNGNQLIFGSADGQIYAIDRVSGALQWKIDAHAPVVAGAAIAEGVAAIAATDGRVLGLEPKTGKVLWTAHGDGMYQSRAVADGMHHVFVGGWDNYFRCFDIQTGEEKWKQKMGKSHHYSPAIGSPAVNDTGAVVFVSSDDGLLHALDTTTGTVVWEVQDALGYSSPLFSGDSVFSGSLADDGSVYRFDAKNGMQQWKKATGSVIYDSSCALLAGKDIVLGSVDGTVSALRASSGSIHWQYRLPPGHLLSTPWANADHVFVANMSGDIAAFSAE